MTTPRHSLSVKDPEAKTAVCSICGPVRISRSGTGWVCRNKAAQHKRDWSREHPESRGGKSEHHLTEVDPDSRRGVCPVDGEVTITASGRGWMCGVRALELGREVDPEARPTEQCIVCRHFSRHDNPVKDGRCLYHFVGWEHAGQKFPEYTLDVEDGAGTHTVTLGDFEKKAAKVDNQSAVRGWKTLGETVPKNEWAKWNQLLASEGL